MTDYHPIINFIYFTIVMGVGMCMNNPAFIMIGLIASLTYCCVLKGVLRTLKYVLKFVLPVIIIITLVNPLFNHYGATILFYLDNGNAVTLEAIVYGLVNSIVLGTILIWFQCFNYVMTSDKLMYLFVRISPKFALMFSMSLKLIPELNRRFKAVQATLTTQKGLLARIKQGIKTISIVITWSLEEAIQTADSMRAREYGLRKRTNFSIFYWQKRDIAQIIIMLALVSLIILGAGSVSAQYNPVIKLKAVDLQQIITIASFAVASFMPIFIKAKEVLIWKRI